MAQGAKETFCVDDCSSAILDVHACSSSNHLRWILPLFWLLQFVPQLLRMCIAPSNPICLTGADVLQAEIDRQLCGFMVELTVTRLDYQRTRKEIGEEDGRFRAKSHCVNQVLAGGTIP